MTIRSSLYAGFGVFALTAFVGCGSVNFGEDAKQATQEQTAQEQTAAQTADPMANVDCDALMQQLAQSCFSITAFEADGQTPLHVADEAGNDLGEVDQVWASHYCECYAQLAFQTFGCETIVTHQSISDEEYDKLYAPIIASCEEPPQNMPETGNADNAQNENPADGDAADQSLKEQVKPVDDTQTP